MAAGVSCITGVVTHSTVAEAATTRVTTWVQGEHRPAGPEYLTLGRCGDDEILVGRWHGGWEKDETKVRCARTSVAGVGAVLREGKISKTDWFVENTKSVTCPNNMVVYQRLHVNDHTGTTQLRCQGLNLHVKGAAKPVPVQTTDSEWTGLLSQPATFTCPANKAITGWYYQYSTNQNKYRCSALEVVA